MKISKDFGIVIRKNALQEKAVDLSDVLSKFNFETYYDESLDFLSLGLFLEEIAQMTACAPWSNTG